MAQSMAQGPPFPPILAKRIPSHPPPRGAPPSAIPLKPMAPPFKSMIPPPPTGRVPPPPPPPPTGGAPPPPPLPTQGLPLLPLGSVVPPAPSPRSRSTADAPVSPLGRGGPPPPPAMKSMAEPPADLTLSSSSLLSCSLRRPSDTPPIAMLSIDYSAPSIAGGGGGLPPPPAMKSMAGPPADVRLLMGSNGGKNSVKIPSRQCLSFELEAAAPPRITAGRPAMTWSRQQESLELRGLCDQGRTDMCV